MALQPATYRMIKLFTGVATTWIGYQTVLRTEYNPGSDKPHVFTEIQRSYNREVDKFLGVPEQKFEDGATWKMREGISNPVKGIRETGAPTPESLKDHPSRAP